MNEPIAYIPFAWYCAWFGNSAEPVWEQYEECHPSTKKWDNFPDKIIPLYTHPAKTLTDDEIRILINEVPDYNIDIHDLMEFARAILRKAQEK